MQNNNNERRCTAWRLKNSSLTFDKTTTENKVELNVWRTEYVKKIITPKVRHGGGSMMIFSCFTGFIVAVIDAHGAGGS